MVNGHEDISPTSVMAVDLDGTYIRGNTLKMYIKAGCLNLARNWHFMRLLKVVLWVGARRIRLTSHLQMKLKAAAEIGWNGDIEKDFINLARPDINPAVARLISDFVEAGGKCLIASAAFGFYIPSICTLPFVATGTSIDDIGEECRGDEKCRRINKWLNENGYTLHSVVTDHSDDIPLLKLPCSCRYLVNPSESTLRAVNDSGVKDVVIIR